MSGPGASRVLGALRGWPAAAAAAAAVLLTVSAPPTAAAQQVAVGGDFGKPVAPFSLAAEAVAPPAVGVPVEVRITLATRTALEDVEVRLSADPGLSVDAASFSLVAPSASPDEPAEWRITIVPVTEGAHRLRLFGEALVGGQRQGRSAVATIRVGAGSAAERDSTVQGAEAPEVGELRVGERPPRRKSGTADEPDRARNGDTEAERVIRLPAAQRP